MACWAENLSPTANEDASPVAKKKQKATKGPNIAAAKPVKEIIEKEAPKKSALKKEKSSKKQSNGKSEEPAADESIPSDNENEDIDADTQALVETLDGSDEADADNDKEVGTYKRGQNVGKIPKARKGAKAVNGASGSGKPGVMYLGSIPHGFYEHEIREYFSQFGDITRLRVVRNKKTGASRHRAFVEFADTEVADIAARTMDNYLLFGHILKAKVIHPDQVHRELFKGANRRFNVVPWNAMQGRHLQRPLAESKWEGKITKEEQRRVARAEKLKALGYEFEPPALKVVAAKEQTQIEYTREEMEKAVEVPKVKQIEEKGGEVKEAEETATISTLKTKKVKASKVKKVKA